MFGFNKIARRMFLSLRIAMAKKTVKDTKENLQQSWEEQISVFGAREHNLKNVDISIPKINWLYLQV